MTTLVVDPQPGRPSTSLHFAVGEINGKMDQLLSTILPQLADIRKDHDSLDGRVGVVETKVAWATGAGAVIIFLITSWEVIRVIFNP